MYRGNDQPTQTYGVVATLVTSASASEESVYLLVRSVFENFDAFRRLHPSLANLSHETMIRDGLTAPLHPGAARYFRERGWIR